MVTPSQEFQEWKFQEGEIRLRIRSVPCLDALLDDDLDLDNPPYWAVAWPSGAALARWLIAATGSPGTTGSAGVPPGSAGILPGIAGSAGILPAIAGSAGVSPAWPDDWILELGCGAGLVGLAAASLGLRVVQTDYVPAALAAAAANARRNQLSGIRRVVADWQNWPLRCRFPLILGADITYERALHPPLRQVLERSLAPGGSFCFADPGRAPTLAFAAALEREGWRVELAELRQEREGEPLFLYCAAR